MKLVKNVKNSYDELVHKVSWPTWSQLVNSAVIVMVTSMIFSLVVWGMDEVFERLMEALYQLVYNSSI